MLLLLPQHTLEHYLEGELKELGVTVQRGKTVTGVKQAHGGVEIVFADGKTVKSKYVVGADGSRSTVSIHSRQKSPLTPYDPQVRESCGITFADPVTGLLYHDSKRNTVNNEQNLPYVVLADIHFEHPLPPIFDRSHVTMCATDGMTIINGPLPSSPSLSSPASTDDFWRFGLMFPPSQGIPPREPDLAWIQAKIDAMNPWSGEIPIRIKSAEHASRYRLREAVASTIYKPLGGGHVLLIGDAAHVHSPAGGQGWFLPLLRGGSTDARLRHESRNMRCNRARTSILSGLRAGCGDPTHRPPREVQSGPPHGRQARNSIRKQSDESYRKVCISSK